MPGKSALGVFFDLRERFYSNLKMLYKECALYSVILRCAIPVMCLNYMVRRIQSKHNYKYMAK